MIFLQRTKNLLWIVVLLLAQCFIKRDFACPSSLETLHTVDRCPRNKLEWEVTADRFNCSSINQTCVPKEKFVYHCVLNADGTALVEVCAPYTFIHGKRCTEFDSSGRVIQENANSCSNTTVSCPDVYKSTDAFNYQSCYDKVQMRTDTAMTNSETNVRSIFVWIFILMTASGVCLFANIIYGLFLKKWKKNLHSQREDENNLRDQPDDRLMKSRYNFDETQSTSKL